MKVIRRHADAVLQGRVRARLATIAAVNEPLRVSKKEKDLVNTQAAQPLTTDIQKLLVSFLRTRSYIFKDRKYLQDVFLKTFVKDIILPLVTSRNLCSNRITDALKDCVFVLDCLPFKLGVVITPDPKRKGYRFDTCCMVEHKSDIGKLYLAGSTTDAHHYMMTQHCFDRLCERLGLTKYDDNVVKELYAVSLFTKPRLVMDNGNAHLIFDDFMCLGEMIHPTFYFFKTIITKNMYTDKQLTY